MVLHFLMTSLLTLNQQQKIENYAIMRGESVGKLINRIPGSRLRYIENTRLVSFDIKFTRLGFENAC